ncbi:MAG: hypothetical protein S0880_30125 [Actinomycetota bacterium]|nr:hypothetical protein [Actinomycetota bacterium]
MSELELLHPTSRPTGDADRSRGERRRPPATERDLRARRRQLIATRQPTRHHSS